MLSITFAAGSLFLPRIALIVIAFVTNWFSQVWHGEYLWAIVGWVVMPYTTLAYMAMILNKDNGDFHGWVWVALIIFAALVDLGQIGNRSSDD